MHKYILSTSLLLVGLGLQGCGLPTKVSQADSTQSNQNGSSSTNAGTGTAGTGTSTSGTSGTGTTNPGTGQLPSSGTMSPSTATVRLEERKRFVVQFGGSVSAAGTWSVVGGAINGVIDQSGTYTAPDALPANTTVLVAYDSSSVKATASVALANPVPVITSAALIQPANTRAVLTVEGKGFVPQSVVLIDGQTAPCTFKDKNHLEAAVAAGLDSHGSIAVRVSNPVPGSVTSDAFAIHLTRPVITVDAQSIAGGDFTLTFTRAGGLASDTAISLGDVILVAVSSTTDSVKVKGYLAPWTVGDAVFRVSNPSGQQEVVSIPINAVAVAYDAAQRLAMQTAFGPRPDVIDRIQKIGMKGFLDHQMNQAADVYPAPDAEQPNTHFLRLVGRGPAVLRQRTAWAFQTFIPEMAYSSPKSAITWETTLEKHAFGSFKQILLDAASVPIIGEGLNLIGNNASDDPNIHPNQNFAREFMQLFSLGAVLLNEDGTPKLDADGTQQQTYGEDTVLAMSRVFTGWGFAPKVDPAYTLGEADYSQPLVANERFHDHGAKVLFGNVVLRAGQSAADDREQAIEAVFQHPNLPPFICRLLIQRFVKSQPSPEYVRRIVDVFKDNGAGVRGDLKSVIQAVLLDPEARAADTVSTAADGFLQDPLYAQLSAMHLLGIDQFDDQPIYNPGTFGEPWWHAYSVFAYFSPSYIVPGTTINSPEFQLLDDIRIVQRSQFLWGVATQAGIGTPLTGKSPIYTQFPTLLSLTDALDHELYHGTMPQHVKDQIKSYCSTIDDHDLQLESAVFLALSSDQYTVVQ